MSASEHRTPGGFCEQMGELAQPNKLENLDYLQLVRLLPEEVKECILYSKMFIKNLHYFLKLVYDFLLDMEACIRECK